MGPGVATPLIVVKDNDFNWCMKTAIRMFYRKQLI